MRRSVMPDAVASLLGIRHAFTRAVVVQRQSLVWPGTSSARGGSFLARPGTCRASPAAPLALRGRALILDMIPITDSLFAVAFEQI
jgi:hypothetical protein